MNFTKDDLYALGKGLIIALIGSALTYLTTYITGHDFGMWTPMVVAMWSVIVNAIRKLIDSWVEEKTGMRI